MKKKTKKTRWHHHLIDKHQRHSNRTEPLNKQPEDGEASERGRFGSGPGRSRLKWRSWRNPAIPAGSSAGDNESRRERRSIRFFHPRSLPRRLPSPIRYKNCSSLPKRGTTLPFPFLRDFCNYSFIMTCGGRWNLLGRCFTLFWRLVQGNKL